MILLEKKPIMISRKLIQLLPFGNSKTKRAEESQEQTQAKNLRREQKREKSKHEETQQKQVQQEIKYEIRGAFDPQFESERKIRKTKKNEIRGMVTTKKSESQVFNDKNILIYEKNRGKNHDETKNENHEIEDKTDNSEKQVEIEIQTKQNCEKNHSNEEQLNELNDPRYDDCHSSRFVKGTALFPCILTQKLSSNSVVDDPLDQRLLHYLNNTAFKNFSLEAKPFITNGSHNYCNVQNKNDHYESIRIGKEQQKVSSFGMSDNEYKGINEWGGRRGKKKKYFTKQQQYYYSLSSEPRNRLLKFRNPNAIKTAFILRRNRFTCEHQF